MSNEVKKENPKKNTPESLRADYVQQLNALNGQLSQLEGEKLRLTAYREQLKGAIFALDQVLVAQAQPEQEAAAASTAEAPKASESQSEAPVTEEVTKAV